MHQQTITMHSNVFQKIFFFKIDRQTEYVIPICVCFIYHSGRDKIKNLIFFGNGTSHMRDVLIIQNIQ